MPGGRFRVSGTQLRRVVRSKRCRSGLGFLRGLPNRGPGRSPVRVSSDARAGCRLPDHCALLPGRRVWVDTVGARAGVDDSTEPRGKAGADAVVVSSKSRIGLKLAAETDLHLPGEGKVRSKDFAMPLDELIRFWATGCDADVQRIPESAVELGYGVGDVLPFLRTPRG
ncbi:protein of unknown function [Streptomyces sp. KY75]|nr:protein of unknown function [Streptomyces sp. KY70]CAD5984030.1 protein of unknown function [Streptomyces sp. KY75]